MPWASSTAGGATTLIQSERRRLIVALLTALLMVAATLALGAFKPDPTIANRWTGYHYGNESNRVAQINLGAQRGVTMIVQSARAGLGLVRLEDHQANWYFDDIGYIFFGQLYTSLFGEITAADLARFHNGLFLTGLIGFVAVTTFLTRSLICGLLLIPVTLILHRQFAGFSYNSVSNHSLIVPAVAFFIPWLMASAALLRSSIPPRTLLAATLIVSGALAGAMGLFRSPVGTGAILSLLIFAVTASGGWRRRLAAVAWCLSGYFLVMNVIPGVAAIHRDLKLDWPMKGLYFAGAPKHAPNFTLLALVGRYPNSLDLKLRDRAVDDLLGARQRAEPKRYPRGYDSEFERIARDVLIQYIREHPGEFLRHRLRGFTDLPWVVPAVTFQANDNFAGSPWTTPAIEPLVAEQDRRPAQPNQIINLRLAYVDISPLQWTIYLTSIALVIAGLILALRRRADGDSAIAAFWGIAALTGLYAAARGLIPWWGQDFVFMFWVTATYAGALLLSRLFHGLPLSRVPGRRASSE